MDTDARKTLMDRCRPYAAIALGSIRRRLRDAGYRVEAFEEDGDGTWQLLVLGPLGSAQRPGPSDVEITLTVSLSPGGKVWIGLGAAVYLGPELPHQRFGFEHLRFDVHDWPGIRSRFAVVARPYVADLVVRCIEKYTRIPKSRKAWTPRRTVLRPVPMMLKAKPTPPPGYDPQADAAFEAIRRAIGINIWRT